MENNECFLKKLCVLEPLDHFVGQTEPQTLNDEKLGASKDPPIWSFGHLWRGNETDLEICALKAEGITSFSVPCCGNERFLLSNHEFSKFQEHYVVEVKSGCSPRSS